MLKLLTELQKLKGRWITFTELQELEKCKTHLQEVEKLNKHYLFLWKEENRENTYLRRDREVLTKKYTILKVVWICLLISNIIWISN